MKKKFEWTDHYKHHSTVERPVAWRRHENHGSIWTVDSTAQWTAQWINLVCQRIWSVYFPSFARQLGTEIIFTGIATKLESLY